MNGKKVKMIFPDEGICSRIFPTEIAKYLKKFYEKKGVEIFSKEKVTNIENTEITLESGRKIIADSVIAGIGIKPNTELAASVGLKIDNGIIVDEYLRTNIPYIYAAGDVANFYNPSLGERIRVEHEDNANKMGRHAGEVMAGEEKPYHHLPFFYSDLFELGYEAVGELDSRYETFVDWKEPYKEGVIYYLKNRRVKGVLLWNVWKQVNAARELIAEKGPFKPEDLKGKLPKN